METRLNQSELTEALNYAQEPFEDSYIRGGISLKSGLILDSIQYYQDELRKNPKQIFETFIWVQLSTGSILATACDEDPSEIDFTLYSDICNDWNLHNPVQQDLLTVFKVHIDSLTKMYNEFGNCKMLRKQLEVVGYKAYLAGFIATKTHNTKSQEG